MILQMIGIFVLVLLDLITAPIMLFGLASWRSATVWGALSDESIWRHAVLLGLLVNLVLDLPFVVFAVVALVSWRHHQIRLVIFDRNELEYPRMEVSWCLMLFGERGLAWQVWSVFGLVILDLMFLPFVVVRAAWHSSMCRILLCVCVWPFVSDGHRAVDIQRAAPTASYPRHLGELVLLQPCHQPVPCVRSRAAVSSHPQNVDR